jgi:hypothetical protein
MFAVQSEPPPAAICTTVGCSSGVGVDLEGARRLGAVVRATLCINATCQASPPGDGVRLVDPTLSAERVRVRLVLRDRRGKVLKRAERDVVLHRLTPNGEACSPACWWRSLRLNDDGRLVATS